MHIIGLDIMGGDFAPELTLKGAKQALAELASTTRLALIGPKKTIEAAREEIQSDILCIAAEEKIPMTANPSQEIKEKPNSSIAVGLKALKANQINAFASAGHSGAIMVGATQILGVINGISRPVIAAAIPKLKGGVTLLLDVGLNADCNPEQFVEFALLGQAHFKKNYSKNNPKIALLNIGSEPNKGSSLYKLAFELLAQQKGINFIGNAETNLLYDGDIDILICDGFSGNLIIKHLHAFYALSQKRGIKDDFLEKLNYELYGGTPVLGLKGNVVIGHGASSQKAIKNMILAAESIAVSNFADQLTSI